MTSLTAMQKMFAYMSIGSKSNNNFSSWDLASINSCEALYIDEEETDPGDLCHPQRLLDLGCFSSCCATSVARSDYSDARAISGSLGNSTIEVTCDTGYSHVTDTNVLVCNNNTGIYDGWELFNCTGHKTSYSLRSPPRLHCSDHVTTPKATLYCLILL